VSIRGYDDDVNASKAHQHTPGRLRARFSPAQVRNPKLRGGVKPLRREALMSNLGEEAAQSVAMQVANQTRVDMRSVQAHAHAKGRTERGRVGVPSRVPV